MNIHMDNATVICAKPGKRAARGFTLVELLVAMTIFLVIGGCAFTLFNQQISSSMSLRGQVGLNLSLRNAASQMQMDMVNAGMNYFQSYNMSSWPIGISIVNNVVNTGSSCFSGGTYTFSCYDKLNILLPANLNTYPWTYASDSTGGSSGTANCSDTSTGIAYAQASPGYPVPPNTEAQALAQTAAEYSARDQLLFYTNSGKNYTTVVLTAAPKVVGSAVKFVFNATNADGSNSQADDPMDITTCQGNLPCTVGPTGSSMLKTSFCGTDYIVKLAPVQYYVDSSNPADAKLIRKAAGVTNTVMDQVIGFKVGATIWNAAKKTDDTSTTNVPLYIYDSSTYWNANPPPGTPDEPYNFTLVRSLRISLIGRTAPGTDPYTFKNSFDQGSYTVQGIAVVVNPRNMSMRD